MASDGTQQPILVPDADGRRALLLGVPAGILADAAIAFAVWLLIGYDVLLRVEPGLRATFALEGVVVVVRIVAIFSAFCGLWLLTAFALSFWRGRVVLSVLRKGFLCVAALFCLYVYAAFLVTGLVFARELTLAGQKLDAVTLFHLRWHLLWPGLIALGLAALAYIWAWQRASSRVFAGDNSAEPDMGDRVLENLRTHGDDPPHRKSILFSSWVHLLVIVIIPWLLQYVGCVEPYRVPKGRGNPVVALLKIVPPKRKKPPKKFLLNPNSAIIFYHPDVDDSTVEKQVDEESRVTYKVDPNRILSTLGTAKAGKMGAGGDGPGGWPDGMENAKVRFIRMEYNGPGWDDGMDAVTRADLNFLDTFHELTGFKVADRPESHPIRLLSRYPKGYAPPFVYMTGHGTINVSSSNVKTMRNYLLDGGMLFADCGGRQWHGQFDSFAKLLFPGQRLQPIADDDPVFRYPYPFPNGAPPLWHHGGTRALGIKHKGRLVVFYHPGDVNDAWKTGHSGMDPRLAEGATQMGVNIVYYSFTNYLELTKKYRK